jgi:hypothetical protein
MLDARKYVAGIATPSDEGLDVHENEHMNFSCAGGCCRVAQRALVYVFGYVHQIQSRNSKLAHELAREKRKKGETSPSCSQKVVQDTIKCQIAA